MADLLLEIGLEEIPARMIASAEAELARRVRELIARERLVTGELALRSYSTPRRLAVLAAGVAAAQPDAEEQLVGPAWSVAFKNGEPTPAAHAFARKAGVELAALKPVTTAKGEYVSATLHKPGRAAAEVLAGELGRELAAIAWPKNMYWRPGKPERYVRPVKWLVALLGEAVLPVEFAGVQAGNRTWGHRVLHGAEAVVLQAPAGYASALEQAYVLADVPARRQRIRKALDHVTRTVAYARWREDEALVESVTHLTEWPSVVLGAFDPAFLDLPEEVLVTVMRDHQKYFALEGAEGKLLPHFLAVLNTEVDEAGAAIIRHGNERVLRARFNDARFFWDFDQKTPLTERVTLLANVTFQKDLGSYAEKSARTRAIALELAELAAARGAAVDVAALSTAAELAKTDLTSELVKEFTELQGIVGGLYARAQGLGEAVVQAIYHQYKPASTEDAIPPTVEGQLLGLADRIGTVVDLFAIGLAPSGSRDPYALRRAANGVVKILAEGKLPLSLDQVEKSVGAAAPGVREFLRERVEFYLREHRGYSFDTVRAVLAAVQAGDLPDLLARAEAVTKVRGSDDFVAIAAALKRSKNLLRQAEEKALLTGVGAVAGERLTETPEQQLHAEVRLLGPRIEQLRDGRAYPEALAALATLRPHVDLFFDKVMVMVPDAELRSNRLALLAEVNGLFASIADFSEIVPAGEQA